ncbi:MAG: hypothetical protein WCG78_00165 [Candidatus Omnitrophota bacterium]
MKKTAKVLISLEVAIFLLAGAVTGYATSVGNTGDVTAMRGPGVFSLKNTRNISIEANIEGDVVINRSLSATDASKVAIERSQWYMFKLGYRFLDRIEPYVKLGAAHLKARWTDNLSGTKVEMDTSSGFAWGVGLKALICDVQFPKIKVTADGSYRTADLDPYQGYFDNTKTAIDKRSSSFVIREWQAALLASTEIDVGALLSRSDALRSLRGYKLSPYGGVKYSEISGRLRMVTAGSGSVYHPSNIQAAKNFGLVAGCDLVGDDVVAVNVEGRFIDETAVSAGLSMLF